MKYTEPRIDIKEFSRSIVTELSGTNKADAEKALAPKANGGYTKVSFDDLSFTL